MSVVQMTMEQLKELVESIRSAVVAAAPAAAPAPMHSKGSFTSCESRFGGQRDHDAVEQFITSVVTFKDIENITDEDALRGLSLLFFGLASTWWQGVKREAKTWNDALELIRSHFSPSKPAYQIYTEIFQTSQSPGVAIDTFVCQKRALLAQLPEGRHNEENEIDFIYGLLNVNYRKHIARHDVKTFRELLEKGRSIEHTTAEGYQVSAAQNDNAPTAPNGNYNANDRPSCTHCGKRGHMVDNCRKKKRTMYRDAPI
ncbi:activity-regulated cytoskeleton associated protein 2-like [Episyrphus balteatus]|uniref:activity-regulated cytoskeleton associated protein 2-like n=1 Tax=Episyrphus balteatus TaxID=286459 RepID=UPI002485A557|nr:activity-regulated cytoskeleton associated protein 2-like [Episyrphus balteatus]